MARLRDSWCISLPVDQQPRNPQSESIARTPYEINGSVVHLTMLGQTALTLSKRGQGGPALSWYFFGYNFEADQGVRPERQGQGNIGSISPARDQNPTDPRIVVARFKNVPPPPEKHLDPGREIHWCIGRRKPDVTDVPCAVSGRDIQAAA